IITCSTSSWSITRHISVMSLINSLLALVGSIVADNDWLPFVSLSFVDVACKAYSLPSKSITCIYSPPKEKTPDYECLSEHSLVRSMFQLFNGHICQQFLKILPNYPHNIQIMKLSIFFILR